MTIRTQHFYQSRACVPSLELLIIIAREIDPGHRGHRNKGCLIRRKACRLEERSHGVLDVVEPILRPVDLCQRSVNASTIVKSSHSNTYHIHLVHAYDEFPNSQSTHEQSMLSRLTAPVETRFKLSGTSIDHQKCEISLGCARDHVGNKVLMARRVEEGECAIRGIKMTCGDIYGDASEAMSQTML